MKKYQIVIGLIISLVIISCDTSTNPAENLQIFPLKVGNIWIYQNYSVFNEDSLTKKGLDTIRVMKDTIISNYKFYYVNYFGGVYDFGYNQDSLFAFVDPTNQYLKPSPIYAFPCSVGDIYFSDLGLCRVENTDTMIRITSGNYHCIKYKFYHRNELGEGPNNYHYCSPGIGLVKIERYHNSYSNLDKFVKTGEMELINFKVK